MSAGRKSESEMSILVTRVSILGDGFLGDESGQMDSSSSDGLDKVRSSDGGEIPWEVSSSDSEMDRSLGW